VIGIPAAFIALRSDLSPRPEAAAPPPSAMRMRPDGTAREAPAAPPPVARLAERQPSSPPADVHQRDVPISGGSDARQLGATGSNAIGKEVAASPSLAAPFAPPPPAPAAPVLAQRPAADAAAEKDQNGASDQLEVTGSLMALPDQHKAGTAARSAERDMSEEAQKGPDWLLKDRSYAIFLTNLQAAVRSGDHVAVTKLIRFPLRVNYHGASRSYRDAAAVVGNYDLIFTPRVRQSILDQRFDRLFGRDQGVMIGAGEVWFDHVCTKGTACSPPGAVRILSINP